MIKLLLGLLATAKLGKVALTSGTMPLSVRAYSLVFGWRYAAGFVALIFAHERGKGREAALGISARRRDEMTFYELTWEDTTKSRG